MNAFARNLTKQILGRDVRWQRGAASLLALAWVALAGCAPRPPTGSVRHLDAEYGFRSAHFEQALASFEGLEFIGDKKGLSCYRKTADDLELGSATLGYIHYCFFGDRLASVMLWGTGAETANQMLQEMRRLYGKGQPLTSTQGRSKQPVGEIWNGNQVTVVLLFMQRDSYPQVDDSQVVVTLSSNRMMEKRSPPSLKVPPSQSSAP